MSRKKITNLLSTGVLFLACLYPTNASGQILPITPEPVEINQLSTPQRLVIPPIQQAELLPGVSADGTVAVGNDSVASPQSLLAPPILNTSISREFPNLWLMRVPLEDVPFLYANYEIRAGNGKNNAVSNEENTDSTAPVVLEPLPITIVSQDANSNTAVVQGGVRLRMDITASQVAGEYSGDLIVTVNRR